MNWPYSYMTKWKRVLCIHPQMYIDKIVYITDTETANCSKLYKRYRSTVFEVVVEMRSLLSLAPHDRTNMGQTHSHTKMRGFYILCTHMDIFTTCMLSMHT